ncbi:MAG: putative efflux pump rane transporter TtgB [Planctomycetota bacterium]|jgi:multidrug efflux pump subunit AcrB
MWLIRVSIRNPHMVGAFILAIAILGGVSLWNIPVDILPVFKAPAVQVLTYYPGMPAESIEKTITNRIERWVSQAPGARLIESRSVPGMSIVKIYFRDDIDPNEALTLTNSLALGALPTLPPNTLPPVAIPFDATGTLPVGILTVRNPNLDDARQKDLARIEVRNMLGSVAGCISPVVVGGLDRTVMLYLDPDRMEARNLVPMDVVNALKKGNLMMTPGTVYIGKEQLLLDSNAMVNRVEELNRLPITFGGAQSVFLEDIGKAQDSATIQTSRVRIDGNNEVFVPIYRQRGASSLSVVDGVRRQIPEMEQKLPEQTKLALVMDQTLAVRRALTALFQEGLIGVVLVAFMILLFLGDWRMTMIATLSIPLSLLGAVVGLYATGNTINTMTLAGLALAIGPLVDDAIVELENNHRNYHLGKSRVRAALDGCAEVIIPVIVATSTTVIVLAPLALMPGIAGFLFRPLTVSVGFAMLTSFLLSRTFVPMMCSWFLPDESRGGSQDQIDRTTTSHEVQFRRIRSMTSAFNRRFQSVIESLQLRYLSILKRTLENRLKFIFLILALFVSSLGLLNGIGREFFPQVDAGQITMRLRVPSYSRLDTTEDRVKSVESFLRRQIPETDREMIISELGLNPDWSAAYTSNAGQQDALIRIQLKNPHEKSSQEYAFELRQKFLAEPEFSDLQADWDTGGMISAALNYGSSAAIDIELTGGTTEQANRFAQSLKSRISQIPGTADVRILQRTDAPYLVLEVDREKAARLGLATDDVMQQVVVALNSSVSIHRNFWIDTQTGNQYFVGVQYPEDTDRKLEEIFAIPVTGTAQTQSVNLGSLVRPRRRNGAVEINHTGLKRVTNLLVNTQGRDVASLAADVGKVLDEVRIPEGLKVQMKGEFERMNESFRRLGLGLLLAAVLVYLLQVTLFRSWSGPGVIMFTVPLGFMGVLAMLYLSGTTLNVQSLMGMIFLVGIAVNNGVLLVEFANKQQLNGLNPENAIIEAARTRFRPILMTFLATVLALTPMAVGGEHGNEANIPLARAVVGGLISSTTLTLLCIPVMYTFMVRKVRPPIDIDHA